MKNAIVSVLLGEVLIGWATPVDIVNWNGTNYVDEHITIDAHNGRLDLESAVVGINPLATSSTFYAAAEGADGTSATYRNFYVYNSDSYDALGVQDTTQNSTPVSGLRVWKKEDFLNGMSNVDVGLTSFSAKYYASGSSAGTLRWVVGIDEDFYVSNPISLTRSTTTDIAVNLSDPSLSWLTYDPSTSVNAFGSVTNLTDFSSIDAVGFWTQARRSGGTHQFVSVKTFSAEAIPEPAVLGLMGFPVVILMVWRRRKFYTRIKYDVQVLARPVSERASAHPLLEINQWFRFLRKF